MTQLIARLSRWQFPMPDAAWIAFAFILASVALLDMPQFEPSVRFTINALLNTAPYIIFAVIMIAWLKASGADGIIAEIFKGHENRMIVLAALFGGLAPFCSCEVIPFIAGLLAMGAPLAAVMAFWLSSPLIDPPSLMITAGALGWEFALAKAAAAVAIGLFGGFSIKFVVAAGGFSNPLRPQEKSGCGSSCGTGIGGRPVWKFWVEENRSQTFFKEAKINALFLLKWLALAYLLESLMIAYIPAQVIAGIVGGEGLTPIALSAFVGMPAYLNSYAAPALVSGLMEQGMSSGAAMAFMVGGAVSSIPAMTAVFALVKPRVFAAYVMLGFGGAILSGIAYGAFVTV